MAAPPPEAAAWSCSERQFSDGLKAGSWSNPKGITRFGMMEGVPRMGFIE